MIFQAEWQMAEMCPSWARWLPCSVQLLRVVPDPHRFPRRVWDKGRARLDWDAPVWCDPGDLDDWIARAQARHAPGEEELAARHAREDYDARVKIRGERIDLFTTMCRRAGIIPPATLTQLLDCLVGFDLYHRERSRRGSWLSPRLWRNPLDVLPFTTEEALEEAGQQQRERAMLAGAGIRRLAQAELSRACDNETAVTVSLRSIADHGHLPAGQVRSALALLASEEMVHLGGIDLSHLDVDTPIELQLARDFGHAFDFDELPPPEHIP